MGKARSTLLEAASKEQMKNDVEALISSLEKFKSNL